MATQATTVSDVELVNEVRLVGRVSVEPEGRELPSGDTIWTFRVVVPRAPAEVRPHQSVDALECVVWAGRVKRSVRGWHAGDVVEVSGQLRRRFFRSGGTVASRVEVQVTAGQLIRRGANG